ncbi:hypothetical protein [Xanthomonas sp. XNM01]|uniref:hypothetical protein n=1 Tax=Xanthomonas sp. XNM01 TaxID=2769289 RepID=UPI0017833783|nr:hypothetical protein [Xanthomonas sp. XNM01]
MNGSAVARLAPPAVGWSGLASIPPAAVLVAADNGDDRDVMPSATAPACAGWSGWPAARLRRSEPATMARPASVGLSGLSDRPVMRWVAMAPAMGASTRPSSVLALALQRSLHGEAPASPERQREGRRTILLPATGSVESAPASRLL